ncbi:glycine/D-amino acid oxidase-like deaminating enzyme [Mycobacterium frederiksbergense]|uniref:Glycine/D-amino acid oxidase-like deaminating enzyme n=1 Tax=Mycolicibacterium frederiksbergense TaxID=117567 RepID=A0ABT6KYQ9_9MYCO|nr:FAD-dependent oxidoreductase [Mycolicibacterium frederiksbergense]MDH6195836.1 glycine/D-amino acid oxidase-like deaminating enzyme [Mycolicibacterium frederiksbergense]
MSAELRDAEPRPVWWDGVETGPQTDRLAGKTRADLVIVGAGYTGLWAAIEALTEDPGCSVVIMEQGWVGSAASGRNGGFVSESLTHGIAHGEAMWSSELDELQRLGRENVSQIVEFVDRHRIEADLRMVGKTALARTPHQVEALRSAVEVYARHGEKVEFLDREAIRADVDSPCFLAGLRSYSGGLVNPMALVQGLRRVAEELGARIFERTPATDITRTGGGLTVRSTHGEVETSRILLASNAYPPLLRRLKAWMLPVYDYVLATAPLTAEQLASIGWSQNQGLSDVGNQFHYFRRTPDNRILWGGYDAIYHFGNRISPELEQRDETHLLLARHFRETFPQLADVPFTHRWGGVIDTTSRFTPIFGTAYDGRLAYAVGFTGLGVASTRFGAQVALDLLAGRETERTRLKAITGTAVPFPPEPFRWPAVELTRAALAREDETGRRGLLLRTFDRFGVGFNS